MHIRMVQHILDEYIAESEHGDTEQSTEDFAVYLTEVVRMSKEGAAEINSLHAEQGFSNEVCRRMHEWHRTYNKS
jgi:hypothetical protein